MELTTNALDFDFLQIYNNTDPRLLEIDGISKEQLDIFSLANNYLSYGSDISIDQNANVNGKSYGNFQSEIIKPILKLKGYNDLYISMKNNFSKKEADNAMQSIFNGDVYVHDACHMQIPYCWATSISHLVFDGIKNNEQLQSKPPKKRRSFIDMVKEFVIQMAHEIAGAVAISDLFVYYAYYVKLEIDKFKENGIDPNIPNVNLLTTKLRKEIEDDFQSLVHTLNMKLRTSFQSPFTNLSIFDKENLYTLFNDIVYPDNSKPDFDLIMAIQKIFCDWFSCGDPLSKLPYRFPIVTLNIKKDEKTNDILDKKTFKYFCKINSKNGCFNFYISDGFKIASCCRMISSHNKMDSFGNGGISIGSARVACINLARFGHIVKITNIDIETGLHELLNKCKIILLSHRKILEKRIDEKFLRFFDEGIMNLNRLFCTIGINGIYECVEEITENPFSQEGLSYYKQILEFINDYTKKINETIFNCEQVPAENLAFNFAKKDKLLYNMNYEYYSNQFVPLDYSIDIENRIIYEALFSNLLSGGCISHLNLIEKINYQQMKKLIKFIIKKNVSHFAINYNYCICSNGHITTNKPNKLCKICNCDVKEFTRVVGYFTPVQTNFSKNRQHEFKERYFS